MMLFRKSTAHKIILVLLVLFQAAVLTAQVGINQTTPDPSAILDLKSNDRGLLMPRLTSGQIESIPKPPPAGLLVYCTDLSIFCYSDGSGWISLPAWGQKLDFADPSAVQNINAKTNANSNVGIGTDVPNSKLTVAGNLTVGSNSEAPPNGAEITGQVKVGFSAPNPLATELLEVDGNINANGKLKENGDDLLPAGTIVMWTGTAAPAGWALCNGDNGTPDLTGQFIVAAGMGHTVGSIGGQAAVTLSVDQMPSHGHSGSTNSAGNHSHSIYYDSGEGGSSPAGPTVNGECPTCPHNYIRNTSANGAHVHSSLTINDTGNNQPHENRPPFYTLAFIMKL